MKPDARTGANYRYYGPESLERLRFIRSAQATGFSLQDVADLLTLPHQPPCEDVLALTESASAWSGSAFGNCDAWSRYCQIP